MPELPTCSHRVGTPSPLPERHLTLDLIRGIAVMGILAMNIVGFAMPREAYDNPAALGPASNADVASWLVAYIMFDGKMRGLFSLLFGASMLLVIQRADAAGERSERIHFARMAWLLVFGLLHFYLIWWGDILSLYAPIGMIAWYFVYRTAGDLLRLAITLIVVQALALAIGLPYLGSYLPPGDELQLYASGYAAIATYRLQTEWFDPLASLVYFGPETLGYMLLGMAGLKTGFLTGQWGNPVYRTVAGFCLILAVPAYAWLGWMQVRSRFADGELEAWCLVATTLLRPIMVIGLAALAILTIGGSGGWLARRTAAAGRAAFTNYLGTSLLMTGLFYGWGLGWFGRLDRIELWSVVLVMWALMLVWSKPWLDRFRYGPFEWLWRCLARGRIEPILKEG